MENNLEPVKERFTKTVKIKKGKDFDYNGNWIVTIGEKEFKIFRDTLQFSTARWYLESFSNEAFKFLGFTKKEAIEKLIKLY